MDSALIAALIAAFASLFVGLINVFISIHKNKQDIHSTISEYIGGIDEICHTEFTGEHSPSHIDRAPQAPESLPVRTPGM